MCKVTKEVVQMKPHRKESHIKVHKKVHKKTVKRV
jgi:hypothetical protein